MITALQSNRISEFLVGLHADVYKEHESTMHQMITQRAVALVSKYVPHDSGKDICRHLPGNTGSGRVLDVGCGQGYAEKLFQEAGYAVHATTLCKEELTGASARTFADQNGLPMGWTEYFDCVFARHVLEHSPIPFFTLHEFKRCLKVGGYLYLEMPSPDTACNHETNANHYSVLGQRAWQCLIHRAGFEIVEALQHEIKVPAGPDVYFAFLCRK